VSNGGRFQKISAIATIWINSGRPTAAALRRGWRHSLVGLISFIRAAFFCGSRADRYEQSENRSFLNLGGRKKKAF